MHPAKLLFAADTPRHIALSLGPNDVLPTGNEWIALPEIRAADGSIASFNVLPMRLRGHAQFFQGLVDGLTVPFQHREHFRMPLVVPW